MRYSLIQEEIPFYTPVEQIFSNRGISVSEIEHYKNVSESDTYSPALFENIKEGVVLLISHIKKRSRVGILVDVDADGFTSASLLYNYLDRLFPSWASRNLIYYIHKNKQHGLSDVVEKIIDSKVRLVIVPDAGGGDGAYAQQLKEAGIDTLILDHHYTTIEECAPAVVINNQLGGYPNTTLSGVGVVYKFCQYIDNSLGINQADDFLDLVAVGCVADLMPLTDYETLYYIRQGLTYINNPFIKAMLIEQAYSIEKHGGYDPFCIGFYIAPFINATIRVGTMEEKEMLFKAMLNRFGNELVPSGKRGHKGEMVPLAVEACRVCSNVKARQTKVRDENLEIIERLIEERNLIKDQMIVVQLEKELNMDKNILGLIANILMEKYQRPILLLNETEEEGQKAWAGSCRNYEYCEIEDLRSFIEKQPGVLWSSGHSNAFGSCVLDSHFDEFITTTNEQLAHLDFTPMYRVDAIFSENSKAEYILDINSLKPYYGQGFKEPYIAVDNIHVNTNNLQLLSKDKNPTLKITLPNGVELIKFKATEREYDELLNAVIEVVGKCDVNIWMERITPQIKIEAYNIKHMDF